jgi:hypothetical protein
MSRTVRIDREVYGRILEAKHEMEAAARRRVSMSEATRHAINRAAKTEVLHEHAVFMDHTFGSPCELGIAHRGCCPGMCPA